MTESALHESPPLLPMRLILPLLLLASCASAPAIVPTLPADLSLTESIPSGTALDHPRIPETGPAWIEMIEGASKTLDLAFFYASNAEGSELESVILSLEQAARRGVVVRFLASQTFYALYPETLDRVGAFPGAAMRLLDLEPVTGGVMHAKYMVVDDAEAWLGSPNFDYRSLEHIQELGVRFGQESLVLALADVFSYDWALAAGEPLPAPRVGEADFPVQLSLGRGESALVTPAFSPRGLLPSESLWDLPRLERWIQQASESILIQVLTFDMIGRDGKHFEALEGALVEAAQRGVQVRILAADWCKRPYILDGLQELQRVPGISIRLATIPQADGEFVPFARVVHAKFAVFDGERSWVGTSNWEEGYFTESRNVGLLIESEVIGRELAFFHSDLWSSVYAYDLDPDQEYEVPRFRE